MFLAMLAKAGFRYGQERLDPGPNRDDFRLAFRIF